MRLNFNKPIIVAEIGWNFLGNIKLAKKKITRAKASGADAVKFQLWNPKNLKPGAWDNDGRRKLYLKSYLDYKKFILLYRFSKKLVIECFGSVFSYQDLEKAMEDSQDKNHKKYLEIRKRNLHKMLPIPVCKMDN